MVEDCTLFCNHEFFIYHNLIVVINSYLFQKVLSNLQFSSKV
jgi:hypothetical protein